MSVDNRKIRVVIAKLGCDIHERGALLLMTILRDAGIEVVYTGRYQTPEAIANTAIQEDADIIAISDSTGSMRLIAESVLEELEGRGASDIRIVAGGLIPRRDLAALEKMGVTGNYGPGTPSDVIVDHIQKVALEKRSV